jgi:uncharacterized membrane-anchored protein YitT (DUF2179 family)
MTDTNSLVKTGWQLTIVVLSAGLMAFNINTFVHAGGLIPGGFTGLTLLTQEIGLRYLNVQIPFSVVLYALNVIPAILCFRHVGKKFVLYSVLSVFLCGLFTDCMPRMFIDFIQLHDSLLSAVFGGMLNGFAILLCLRVDLSTGGSDFIAIYFSEKYRQNTWNYILVGNSVILVIAGSLFGIERALYSIVFQFSTTVVLNSLYHAYQQKTMLIVTDHPNEIYAMIVENTHHGATLLAGKGLLRLRDHGVIYVVVHANEVSMLINAIRKIDSDSFINVIATEHLNGRFFAKPKD